jgi:hypothetical protein
MRLIDESPALFITICFVVLYTVVGVECAMLISGRLAIMWAFLGLIILVAAGICAWMFRLLSDGAPGARAGRRAPGRRGSGTRPRSGPRRAEAGRPRHPDVTPRMS